MVNEYFGVQGNLFYIHYLIFNNSTEGLKILQKLELLNSMLHDASANINFTIDKANYLINTGGLESGHCCFIRDFATCY